MAALKNLNNRTKEIAEITEKFNNNPIYSSFMTTAKNYHRGYDYNLRGNSESKKRWDCSELSSAIMLGMIKDMKESDYKWKTDFRSLEKAFSAGSTTAHQRPHLDRMNGIDVVRGKKNVQNAELKPGMVIFLQYPTTKGGYSGHVATVTRNPDSGKLMIAESIAGRSNIGVIHRSLNDFFNNGRVVNNPKTKFSLYDPFQKDREYLNQLDKEALQIKKLYVEANKQYKNTSGFIHVGGNIKNNRLNFIENYIKEGLENLNNDKKLKKSNDDDLSINPLNVLRNKNNVHVPYAMNKNEQEQDTILNLKNILIASENRKYYEDSNLNTATISKPMLKS